MGPDTRLVQHTTHLNDAMPNPSHPPGPPDSNVYPPGPLVGGIPQPRTALIGREADLERVRTLAGRADAPVVTIVGPGGVGKTRLALEVATDLAPDFADGVAVVLLASVRNPELVLGAIAQALSLPDVAGRDPAARLAAHLRDRRLLLVLDNVEHLLEAAPSIADVLARCPHVKVVATSRSPLGISGEWIVPLDVLAADAARTLYTTRAQAANPGVATGGDLIPVIDAICARLDRLPLAIERHRHKGGYRPDMCHCPKVKMSVPKLVEMLHGVGNGRR